MGRERGAVNVRCAIKLTSGRGKQLLEPGDVLGGGGPCGAVSWREGRGSICWLQPPAIKVAPRGHPSPTCPGRTHLQGERNPGAES